MPDSSLHFRYRAATPDGRLVDGVLAAESERAALASLEERLLVPVELSPSANEVAVRRQRRSSQRDALSVWARTLATLLKAGVPLDRALTFVSATATNAHVARASQSIRESVQRGESLAAAMRRTQGTYSPVVIAMVGAGEEAGALDAAFARIAAHLEEQSALRDRLRAALSYPALLAVVASLAVLVMMLFVVPRFAAMLEELGGVLPLSTRMLLGVSDVAQRWWWLAALMLLGAIVAVRAWLSVPTRRERWHSARLRVPIAGPIEEGLESARFLRTCATLLESGATVLASLIGARSAVVNTAFGRRLDQAIEDVRRGRTISTAMAGLLPPLALELVAAGEESGSLPELAMQAGVRADDDAQRSLRQLVSFVEPALILLFGLLVGFVALAMLQAIYSVNAATIIR
ncbi:MAG: type II secretion system F family protein [Gemmatimonadaceae bacterium]